jgi:glycoside/pentoside/hexuronide:cation symporter, GPH family
MNRSETIERPPLSILWIYAMGQLGWSLTNYLVSSLLSYFYMPPEEIGAKTIFPNFMPQTTFFGLTLLGIIASSGRIFDAIIDPFFANLSDRSKSRFGKRRFFMGIAALPLSAFAFLIFYPISGVESSLNATWLTFTVFMYFVSFALYVIPYSALISELGHVHEDRLKISTIISVTWAIGFLIGNTTPALQGFFEKNGDPSVFAFQKTVGIFSVVSLIFLLIPVFFLDEKRYAMQGEPHSNFLKSLTSVFDNENFRYFSISYLLYWLSLTFIQSGIIYYVTIMFNMDKSYATLFGTIGFFISFLFYPFIGFMEKRIGKKHMMSYGFMALCFIFTLFILPIPAIIRFSVVSILSAFPLAVFGILPNTIVADIVHQNEIVTGKNQSGMFYGVTAFMMKVGVTCANLIFPSLLILGKSVENPFGVQMSVVAAFVFCMAGFWLFRKYKQ